MNQVIGHHDVIQTFGGALSAGRLAHAWVLHGPVGVGKCLLSKYLSSVILCDDPDVGEGVPAGCGRCDSCKFLTKNDGGPTHPDLHIVHKELAKFSSDPRIRDRKLSSIPLEVLREYLLGPVYRAPQLSRNKVLIVDEAELLSEAGQNLLLKTLEEPPAGTFIFLITSDSTRLLPTVRSRCRMLSFGPIPDDQVRLWATKHYPNLTVEQVDWLVAFAQGSIGRLRVAIDYAVYEWDADIAAGLSRASAGSYPTDLGAQLAQHVSGFAEQWVKSHENASKDAANKQGVGLVLSIVARHARAALRAAAGRAEGLSLGDAEARAQPWLDTIQALRLVEAEVRAGVNLTIALEHLVSLVYRSLRPDPTPVPALR